MPFVPSSLVVRCLRLRSTGKLDFPHAIHPCSRDIISSLPWSPAVTCLVSGSPEEHEKIYLLGDGFRKTLHILLLAWFYSRSISYVSHGGFCRIHSISS